MTLPRNALFAWSFLLAASLVLAFAPASAQDNATAKYELAYKFNPNETVRWKVEHRAEVRTTIAGTTQNAETESFSVKVWRVKDVDSQGVVTFEHSVERVQMRHKLSGRQDEVYDSETDKQPPPAFHDVAKEVGVVLSVIKMDRRGKLLHRENLRPQPVDSQMTMPLPEGPIAIGHSWSIPHEVTVKVNGKGVVKKVQTKQQFTLESVSEGIATIGVQTVILTPIRDQPAIEAQLIQHESAGKIKFDIAAGRIIHQQMDLDKRIVGVSGESSVMHYRTRFIEALLANGETAIRPRPAGPEPFRR